LSEGKSSEIGPENVLEPEFGAGSMLSLDASIFHHVEVRLVAQLGSGKLTVRTMLDLAKGDVVPLETPLDGVADLKLNGRTIARGEIVAVGDTFGIRITDAAGEKP
jgi:flagellar motor switch protein FliN